MPAVEQQVFSDPDNDYYGQTDIQDGNKVVVEGIPSKHIARRIEYLPERADTTIYRFTRPKIIRFGSPYMPYASENPFEDRIIPGKEAWKGVNSAIDSARDSMLNTYQKGGVVKAQGGTSGFLDSFFENIRNKQNQPKNKARLYDSDLQKDVVVELPDNMYATGIFGWPNYNPVYNSENEIISAGNLQDVLGQKGSDYTRTDYYDAGFDSLNPYLYKRKIRTVGNRPGRAMFFGNPVSADTLITKSLLGIGKDMPVEKGSTEYNSVNQKLDNKDSSKVYRRKLGKTYKKNK